MSERRKGTAIPCAAATVWMLAGCGGPPPAAVPPTLVSATASAAADANAGPDGAGAPVAIRIYQLAGPAAFEGAQFFALFNGDADALKGDLVKRDDLLLPPGQSRTLALAPEDRVHAIGVLAAFRDYEHVTWRAVVAVPAHQSSLLTIEAGRAGVTARIGPDKPAGSTPG